MFFTFCVRNVYLGAFFKYVISDLREVPANSLEEIIEKKARWWSIRL